MYMIADNTSKRKWYGNENINADQAGTSNGGLATETQGRETEPSLYENDVLGKAVKRKRNDIWSKGKMKRIKHNEDE